MIKRIIPNGQCNISAGPLTISASVTYGLDPKPRREVHISLLHFFLSCFVFLSKLDGVGPVDNRPSTDKLHHFAQKKKRKKKKKKNMWHVTRDTWHVTHNTWHVTCDTWHVTRDTFGGVNILSKFQLSSSYRLWFMILWRSGGKGWLAELINEWMNEWMNEWRGCL